MPAIPYIYAEQTTAQTKTGDTNWADISGANIASGNFTVGRKYLIVAQLHVNINSVTDHLGCKVVHGSTDFNGSDLRRENSATNSYIPYMFFTVWTAISGEAVKVQYKTYVSGSTVAADHITLLAIEISEDLTENTDWHFNEQTSSDLLNTTFGSTPNDASITFIPGTAGDDWLVLAGAQLHFDASQINAETRLNHSGLTTQPLCGQEQEDPNDQIIHSLFNVYNLAAASQTFLEESRKDATGAGTETRERSAVFALNLNKFNNHSYAWTEAPLTPSTTDYATELQTLSITPDVLGDIWLLGGWQRDGGNPGDYCKSRLQVDNADAPAGQTTAALVLMDAWDTTDEVPINHQAVLSMTAAAHTVDIDGSKSGGGVAEDRILVAVTMELAAAAGTTYTISANTTGVGIISQSSIATFAKSVNTTGLAVITATRLKTIYKSIATTGVAVVTMAKAKTVYLSAITTGLAVVSASRVKTVYLSAATTGLAVISMTNAFITSFSSTTTGLAIISMTKIFIAGSGIILKFTYKILKATMKPILKTILRDPDA